MVGIDGCAPARVTKERRSGGEARRCLRDLCREAGDGEGSIEGIAGGGGIDRRARERNSVVLE